MNVWLLRKKALMTRVARLENTKARVAPILYMEGACGVRLKADENVAQIFKMDEPLFRSAISVFMKPLMRYIKKGIFFDDEQLREKRHCDCSPP